MMLNNNSYLKTTYVSKLKYLLEYEKVPGMPELSQIRLISISIFTPSSEADSTFIVVIYYLKAIIFFF